MTAMIRVGFSVVVFGLMLCAFGSAAGDDTILDRALEAGVDVELDSLSADEPLALEPVSIEPDADEPAVDVNDALVGVAIMTAQIETLCRLQYGDEVCLKAGLLQ